MIVIGRLKDYYNQEAASFMTAHKCKTISVYNIAELLGKAYPKAFTPENIISGIRASAVYPTNRDVFKDYQFFLLYVSDRMPTTSSEALTREVSMLSASPLRHLDSFFNIDPRTDAAQVLSLNERQRSADDSLK